MRTALYTAVFVLTSALFTTKATANDWDEVLQLDTCHSVAMNELEFQDCRRSFALRQIKSLEKLEVTVVFAKVMGDFDQDVLRDLLSLDKAELNEALSSMVTAPEQNAAMVRSAYPEWITIGFEANRLFLAEAIKVDDQNAIESAEWFEGRLNMFNDGFSSFCSVFLDDPECQTVTFGDAFPEAPVLDDEQLASAS